MSFVYNPAKARILRADLDFDLHDIRVMLVMTNTTADTQTTAATLSAITTLDEYDGSGYVRKALTGEIVNQDDPNSRAEFDADDVTWTALGAGTRSAQAVLLYRHVDGTAANDQPIAFIDTGGFPIAGNGGDLTIAWNAEGILQAA